MRISTICRSFFLATLMISFGFSFQTQAQVSPEDSAKIASSNAIDTELNTHIAVIDSYTSTSATLTAAAQKTKALLVACQTRMKLATAGCLESTAPSIGQFLTEHGAMVQMLSAAGSSMVGQCSAVGNLLKSANVAVTAFQLECSALQAYCKSACGKVLASAKEYAAAAAPSSGLESTDPAHVIVAHRNNATAIQGGVGKATSLCGSYQANIGSALVGIMTTLTGMKTAQNCKDKNSDTAALDCDNQQSTVYNSTNCRCVRNELPAAECQKINLAALAVPGKNGIAVGAGGVPEASTNEGVDLDDGNAEREVNTDVNTAAAGAPIEGGGGSVSGGGGGGSGAQDGTRGNARSRLNPNILGGFGGGGGSGGASAGPGYGDIDPKMKAYMPGQEKDPARAMASEFKKQVSHPDGRSNWEKINRSYLDNYRNLLKN